MEMLKQNIHMHRICKEGSSQITLEDDMNLPDVKPDINLLCMEKGCVIIDEVRPGTDAVEIKGRLTFSVLYHTQEDGSRLMCCEGKIPFDEKIHVEGLTPGDQVCAEGDVEDLTVGMINSRKLSIQSVINLTAQVEAVTDLEVPVGVTEAGQEKNQAQYRQVPAQVAQLAICKNDVIRIKEECNLQAGQPNIGEILWKAVEPGELNFRLAEEKLLVQGELRVFVLYCSESDGGQIQCYENTVPVNAQLPCSGCMEGMIPDICYRVNQWELAARPDFDGEQRVFGLELTIDLQIKVYEEKQLKLVTDIYGVTGEIQGEKKDVALERILRAVTGRTKVAERLQVPTEQRLLQILHYEARIRSVSWELTEEGIAIRGTLGLKVLYITGDDDKPFECLKAFLPFEYMLEIPGMGDGVQMPRVRARLEQLGVNMLDGEELDVKAILSFSTTVTEKIEMQVVGQVTQKPLDSEKMENLPGMVIYIAKPGDSLWDIGKKYYVPIQSLVELNDLPGQEIKPGQKLLIVK